MTTQTPPRLDIRPVTPAIGAEVHGVDLREPLDPATVAELSDALVQWKVLFFRDQALTRDQHMAFGRPFGDLTPGHPIQVPPTIATEVLVVDTRDARSRSATASTTVRRRRAARSAAGTPTSPSWPTRRWRRSSAAS